MNARNIADIITCIVIIVYLFGAFECINNTRRCKKQYIEGLESINKAFEQTEELNKEYKKTIEIIKKKHGINESKD